MDYNFFLVFILAHLIGDFVLQTSYIAKLKAESKKGLFLHSAIVIISQIALLSFYGWIGFVSGIMSGICHLVIDFLKGKINRYLIRKQFIYFVIDQIIHIFVILVIVMIAEPKSSIFYGFDESIKVLIALIVVIYVSTVAVKILVKDIYIETESTSFFNKYERVFDAIIAIVILGFWFLSVMFLVLLPVLLFIYYKLQYRLYGYSFNFSCTKFVFLAGMSSFVFFFI